MRFVNFLFSGAFMGILMAVFAISIGYATFIENDFDSATAKMLVYNARWFEVLLFLMVMNFIGMIFTRQLYIKSKLNILAIHLSLVIIIIGAGVTRYIGFEGQMHIRQGETTNRYLSAETYIIVEASGSEGKERISKRVLLSSRSKKVFSQEAVISQKPYSLTIDNYMPNAIETMVPDDNGRPMISIASVGAMGRQDKFLAYGESAELNGTGISFGDTSKTDHVQFILQNGALFMRTPAEGFNTENAETTRIDGFSPIGKMEVIDLTAMRMVVSDFSPGAVLTIVPSQDANQPGERVAQFTINDQSTYLRWNEWKKMQVNGADVSVKLGNQVWELPFSLRLNEFQLERYPGSMSPSSFASEITLIDSERNLEMPYRIFMNNILSYDGYRFYQSSYDNDEKGTILSVNHDYWGTVITYIGYGLLFLTLILSLFIKNNRFRRVSRQIEETHNLRKKLLVPMAIFMLGMAGFSNLNAQDKNQPNSEHAASFGHLLVQSKDGRIIPINTIASQVLVKIYKKSSFEGLSSEQVFLGMVTNPEYWQKKAMIKVADPALQSMLSLKGEFASYFDFFDERGQYRLKAQIDEAYAKKPALRNMFDKELIYVDDRLNVCFMTYNGSYLKFYPISDHPEHLWISPFDIEKQVSQTDEMAARKLFAAYQTALQVAIASGNYQDAEKNLTAMKDYQNQEGKSVLPLPYRVKLEVLYNNVNVFKSLFPVLMTLGVLLFAVMFVQIFKPAMQFRLPIWVIVGLLWVAFGFLTAGLIIRWIIAEHAPWSNGYESMIYISWATMLAGFIFMRKSPIILSVTALLSGVTLLTAHMSWLNPEITNLVPVLKSYWLTIHVATITASYGFLGLGSLTAFLNLCIMIFRTTLNKERVNLVLKELTLIIELSVSVGLILLIIGNFLGGVWANESWGRYWGWDPKETWSLVTIIVFTFILHMRLMPGLRNTFSFNFLSMFGFASILMTYFGVNYYLSGLHSYASGDPVPVPTFVYYTLAVMLIISALAAYNDYKIKDQSPMADELE